MQYGAAALKENEGFLSDNRKEVAVDSADGYHTEIHLKLPGAANPDFWICVVVLCLFFF